MSLRLNACKLSASQTAAGRMTNRPPSVLWHTTGSVITWKNVPDMTNEVSSAMLNLSQLRHLLLCFCFCCVSYISSLVRCGSCGVRMCRRCTPATSVLCSALTVPAVIHSCLVAAWTCPWSVPHTCWCCQDIVWYCYHLHRVPCFIWHMLEHSEQFWIC